MVEEIAARKRLGRLDNCWVTAETKKRGWARVAESVSAVGGMATDSDAIKKKWSDIKSAVKKELRENWRGGGGGSTIHVDQLEGKIITEDTEEMRLSQILIHHDTPMYEPVPPRARRLAGVEEMVAVQRMLLGEVTALRRVQEELLKVEGERLALEKEKLARRRRSLPCRSKEDLKR
ncbi:hypothetical protein J4Q44_G00135710 [Coregonus suidteri]|uniref:Myb/SANT-like DNA-binding domain-containing protein n=1 Tax=Coregonus suidteri TaxID=861788 RepID=A0AAN8LZI7_9TELE